MRRALLNISLVFAAGAFGGAVNAVVSWFLGASGVYGFFGVDFPYYITLPSLYSRITWGGLWGFLFLAPFPWRSYFFRGFLYSLGPTLAALFIVLPSKGKGMMGLDLGSYAPVFVLLLNAVWGVSTALWLGGAGEKDLYKRYYEP